MYHNNPYVSPYANNAPVRRPKRVNNANYGGNGGKYKASKPNKSVNNRNRPKVGKMKKQSDWMAVSTLYI